MDSKELMFHILLSNEPFSKTVTPNALDLIIDSSGLRCGAKTKTITAVFKNPLSPEFQAVYYKHDMNSIKSFTNIVKL